MKLNQVVPMLPVRDLSESVAFYQKLGFLVEVRNDEWGWARLRCGDCRLMLDRSINAHPDSPRDAVLYLYPDNIAEYHQQVRGNGLAAPDLEVTFYGMLEFRMEDPDGNRLWIGQSVEGRT
ncbi:MAG: VOC family protein [Chthonomonadales bacterium]